MCGYSKCVGTCTKNLNCVGTEICAYSKFVGPQNLLISKFAGLRFVGTQNLWVLKIKFRGCSNLLVFILKIT